MEKCRICLKGNPSRDISELHVTRNGEQQPYNEVIKFCLEIQISDGPDVNTKLCVNCFEKIIEFYYFKLLAIQNDASMGDFVNDTDKSNLCLLENDVKEEPESEEKLDFNELNLGNFEEPLLLVKEEISVDDGDNSICDFEYELQQTILDNYGRDEPGDLYLSELQVIKKKTSKHSKQKDPTKPKKKRSPVERGIIAGVCELCGKEYKNIRLHIKTHLPKHELPQYKCEYCDKTFLSRVARKKHTQRKHLSTKQECKECGKLVFGMKVHMLSMHNPEALKFSCLICGRHFISQTKLNEHNSIHTKYKPYECEQCGKGFRLKSILKHHIMAVHEKKKPFVCHICPKAYSKKDKLVEHLRSHTNEKPYECPECGKFLACVKSLKNHRKIHAGIKNVKCTLCDASFVHSGNLSTHMKSHLKEKRYNCGYCSAKFHRSDHRNRHERTAHLKSKS